MIMTLSMPFKSKFSPHHHTGGKGYEYACPLIRHQDNVFVTSKGELIEKVLTTLSNGMCEGWKG
jgi:hypothetical protein